MSLFRYLLDTLARLFGGHPTYTPPPAECPQHLLLMQVRCKLLDMHNDMRRVMGHDCKCCLRPLIMDFNLNSIAQAHAEWMALNHCVEHQQPQPEYTCTEEEDGIFMPPIDLVQRVMANYGFFCEAGQNLACGPKDLLTLMLGWKKNEENRNVVLNPGFRHCGFGGAVDEKGRYYWCAIFVRPFMGNMLPPDELGLDLPEPLLAASPSA